MPRIKSFAPSWLNKPAPGHKLFEAPIDDTSRIPAALAYARKSKAGVRRTTAHRGSEVFVAVGKQIRWGDLVHLKETWEGKQARSGSVHRQSQRRNSNDSFEVFDEEGGDGHSGATAEGYRTIKTPVADEIRQLIMSPQQDFMAVLTSHTVHICILPDSSHLHANDTAPFKPKFWTLGPTTHVTSKSAVVSALWHPLGVNGSVLVTVTEDAVVRVWELSMADRWSFDAPTLAIDLKRLADGTFLEQDFSASTSTTNKAFSPDSFDMEVAAACFPGRGSGGWSSMTLWIAMAGGDVYALCPLLPQRWAPPPTLIPSLSVSIVAKVAATEDDPQISQDAKILAQQQLDWMSDLDNQEPKLVEVPFADFPAEVYNRPSRPSTVPKLQGPFQFDLNPDDEQDDEVELKDIFVIGEKINTADLMMGEEDDFDVDEDERDGLSLTVVCLLSTSGQVKICLDLAGVEAQWLPPRNKSRSTRLFPFAAKQASLLTFQTFDTVRPAELTPESWPMFSEDITSRYSFYVTHTAGITHVSLAPWVFRLESELQGDAEAGAEFRLNLLVSGQGSERERIYTHPFGHNVLAAATAISDPDLGHFILSATHQDPVALFFDTPERELTPARGETPQLQLEQSDSRQPPNVWEPRPFFHPSDVLDHRSAVPAWLDRMKTGKRRPVLQQEVRLSIATLEVFTEGHKLVSSEVFDLNNAVAELFRKCEALQSELQAQILKVNEVKSRTDMFSGDDDPGDDEPVTEDMLIKSRLQAARVKQENLAARMEAMRRRIGRATTRELSDKEKAWMEEVRALGGSVLHEEGEQGEDGRLSSSSKAKPVWKRFDEIKALRDSLFSQAEQLQRGSGGDRNSFDGAASPSRGSGSGSGSGSGGFSGGGGGGSGLKIPAEIRKAKVGQVMSMLERESALVDAVKSRLERLSVG